MQITILIHKEENGWLTATAAEIPGVNTQGENMDELMENFKEALQMVVTANRELAEKHNQESTRRELIQL